MRYVPMHGGGLGLLVGIAGFVATLLFIAVVTVLVVYLVRRSKAAPTPGQPGQPGHRPPPPPALQILDERLARGEIDIDDFLNRRAALFSEVPRPSEWTPGADAPAPPSATPPTP